MANFKDWALQYVLSDEDAFQHSIAEKAAREIESTKANRATVGNWAASVQPWMSSSQAGDDDRMDDGDDGSSGDIIARAKALGFLAGTLEALDKNILRTDQLTFLVGFFGAMFSYDHKAGITASTKALRRISTMKAFKPDMGVKMIEDVSKLKEDFRLQAVATRLEIFELFLSLIQNQAVNSELQHKYGTSGGFVVDLLQLCQHERDPRNLMIWFKIIATLLSDFALSPEVTEETFKAFSAYFPISLRASATPIGITADDLKAAVRDCFASSQRVAPHSFPFLIQKLDQGDAVTVAVKVDILRTIKACVERYDNPQTSIVPYVEKIWNSLKYEVRNGEVKETIDATLDVLRAIANRLDGSKTQKQPIELLKNYIDVVFKDCRVDLANPTYTKQAGVLVMTVITSNIRGYVLESAALVDCVRQNLRQPKSPSHTKDLLLILNSFLKSRSELVANRKQGHPDDEEQLKSEPRDHLDALFHDTYLRIWTASSADPGSENIDTLKNILQGLSLLANQRIVQQDGSVSLVHSGAACSEICTLLSQVLLKGLTLSSNDNATTSSLEEEAQLALRAVVMTYTSGYGEFARKAKAEIQKRDWANASEYSLEALKSLLFRLAFVGCSEIPSDIAVDATSKSPSPLQHFITLTATLLDLFPLVPANSITSPKKESLPNSYIIAALHASLLFFRDACVSKYPSDALVSHSKSDANWTEEFRALPENWIQQLRASEAADSALQNIQEDSPEVYRQFLRLGLFLTRHMYRAVSAGPETIWNDRIVGQVANIAALVVRNLSEELQLTCGLAQEAFNHFTESAAANSPKHASELLTRGVLEGLWPGAMAELYHPGGIAETFLCQPFDSESLPSHKYTTRASIGLILTNKYKGGPSTSDPDSLVIKRVLNFWGEKLQAASTSSNRQPLETLNTIAMHVLAGAVARQDKNVLDLVPILRVSLASDHPNSSALAHSLGILVKDSDLLSPDNHAVVRRFYKQWTYSQLAKPLYESALPAVDKPSPAAAKYRAAILSIVSNCAFSVYEADLEPLVRLLIITLGGHTADPGGREHLAPALEILVEILANEPDALKGHIKAIIDSAMAVYDGCLPGSQAGETRAAAARRNAALTASRKLVLQALAAMPKKFEDSVLVSFSLPLQRMLGLACGDPVREVRQVARMARESWVKVV
ncbi:MMS19 nucleotide excision repair protein [Podospora conica]|nr:MMS19 nucleotide excision repair protein [Schizothecium conicum]